jgi:hypothetical protein
MLAKGNVHDASSCCCRCASARCCRRTCRVVSLRAAAAATTAALTVVVLLLLLVVIVVVVVMHSLTCWCCCHRAQKLVTTVVTTVVVVAGKVNHVSCGDVVCESSPFVTVEVKSRLVVSGVGARLRVIGVGVLNVRPLPTHWALLGLCLGRPPPCSPVRRTEKGHDADSPTKNGLEGAPLHLLRRQHHQRLHGSETW